MFNVGDIVWHPCYPDRYWTVLPVTQNMVDLDGGVDVDAPGNYAFGGMWYGTDPLDFISYGKVVALAPGGLATSFKGLPFKKIGSWFDVDGESDG